MIGEFNRWFGSAYSRFQIQDGLETAKSMGLPRRFHAGGRETIEGTRARSRTSRGLVAPDSQPDRNFLMSPTRIQMDVQEVSCRVRQGREEDDYNPIQLSDTYYPITEDDLALVGEADETVVAKGWFQ